MNLRAMRTLLFFDLPTITSTDRRNYRKFVKALKKHGFLMIQESVYVKMSMNQASVDSTMKLIKKQLPPEGNVAVMTVTEKQFASTEFLLGEFKTDVIESQEKYIEL